MSLSYHRGHFAGVHKQEQPQSTSGSAPWLFGPSTSEQMCVPREGHAEALTAVCSASGTPVSGSGLSGRSTSHLCLVKLPTS